MAQTALMAMRDSKARRRQGLCEEVTRAGQRAGLWEGDAALARVVHFFHGNGVCNRLRLRKEKRVK